VSAYLYLLSSFFIFGSKVVPYNPNAGADVLRINACSTSSNDTLIPLIHSLLSQSLYQSRDVHFDNSEQHNTKLSCCFSVIERELTLNVTNAESEVTSNITCNSLGKVQSGVKRRIAIRHYSMQ
jgi:hypothetical protein